MLLVFTVFAATDTNRAKISAHLPVRARLNTIETAPRARFSAQGRPRQVE